MRIFIKILSALLLCCVMLFPPITSNPLGMLYLAMITGFDISYILFARNVWNIRSLLPKFES